MGMFTRIDGTRLKNLPSFRVINPYVMRGRNESAIYFSHDMKIEHTREFLSELNARHEGPKITLFHVFLCALVRILAVRPQLNRFVSGRHIYQRNRIQLSFVVKKELTEEGKETNAKITFDPDETLMSIVEKVNRNVHEARSEKGNQNDHEMDFFAKFPRFAINTVIRAFRILDYFNLAPKGMIEIDPLYTSIYVANLGSVGLDAPYHHLYEWGNASIFVVIGKMKKKPVIGDDGQVSVENIITCKYTMDDRISEGIYCARAINLFRSFVEHPERLMEPPVLSEEQRCELMLTGG